MSQKLPDNLDEALHIIANVEQIDIRKLLIMSLITLQRVAAGWLTVKVGNI